MVGNGGREGMLNIVWLSRGFCVSSKWLQLGRGWKKHSVLCSGDKSEEHTSDGCRIGYFGFVRRQGVITSYAERDKGIKRPLAFFGDEPGSGRM